MEYKFFSPYKCCFLLGIINTPIILIMHKIFSFINCHDTFCRLIQNSLVNMDKIIYSLGRREFFFLIILIFVYGIEGILINRIMNNLTFYHVIIPIQIGAFFQYIMEYKYRSKYRSYNKIQSIIILILFIIEFLMCLIFLEIIELNCCGLSRNIKKNIKKRAIEDLLDGDYIDSVLDDDDEDIGKENILLIENNELYNIIKNKIINLSNYYKIS